MPSLAPEQKKAVTEFLRLNKSFLKNIGPAAIKSKGALAKCHMQPLSSIWYIPAIKVLEDKYGTDTLYTKDEFKRLLEELGYPFSNGTGASKGSGRDYLYVLETFVDGSMKTSIKAPGLDTTMCNMVHLHLNLARDGDPNSFSLKKMVDKFETDNGNSGHSRMKQAVPFILAAQMKRMSCLLEEEDHLQDDMGSPCVSARKRPREESE